MLMRIEDSREKKNAQERLERAVKAKLVNQGVRNIGFPSNNLDEVIFAKAKGELWAAFGTVSDVAIPRRWNAFGVYDTDRHSQSITVEINISVNSNSARVSGFFAKDTLTGNVYLMHTGKVGGGALGVGKTQFLRWSKSKLVDVSCGDGKVRSGIVVGNVDTDDLVSLIWKFVNRVKDFKQAVRQGQLNAPVLLHEIAERGRTPSLNSGRRTGKRCGEIDYYSYHDDVVRCLYKERVSDCAASEQVDWNQLIDLFVCVGEVMTEIYEVKTSTDRQSIYTAIGQLINHSIDASPTVKRTLVLPEGTISTDLERCLKSLSISLRRFVINGRDIPEVMLS